MTTAEYLQTPETVLPRELAFGVLRVAPDIAVEVLSPRPRIGDLHERIEWFARYVVKECWLVDLTRRQVAVLAFEEGRIAGRGLFGGLERVVSAVLPELHLSPSDLFGYQ